MRKVITWSTDKFKETKIKTNCLFYAENLIRHFRYITPLNLKFCLAGEMRGYFNAQFRAIKPGQFIFVWEDLRPPQITFSDDASMAYMVVEKSVVLTHLNEKQEKVEETTHFAWVSIF